MTRAYSTSAWQRDFAAAFAAGVPLEAVNTRARGHLLASDNDEPEDDEPLICIGCNGSGEGMYDGTRCRSCGGSGVERAERDEPDWDAMRKDRIERELIGES